MIKKIIISLGNTSVVHVIFGLLIVFSLFINISFRNNHFQECDSSQVYFAVNHFPDSASTFNRLLYGGIVDKQNNLRAIGSSNWKVNAGVSLFNYRNKVIGVVDSKLSAWPYFIRSAFALPLATTYSFGPGLIYGLFTWSGISVERYLSNATIITQIVFHTSIVLLYLALLRLAIRKEVALITVMLALFSISQYSYGYHLGSTVWNTMTTTLFIFYVLGEYKSRVDSGRVLRNVSILTAVLVWFNYLIILPWLAVLLTHFLLNEAELTTKSIASDLGKMFKMAWTQVLAIISAFTVGMLFFAPGQGYRGNPASINELLKFLYYIVLNFVSLYNRSSIIDLVQFVIFISLFLMGVWILRRKIILKENQLYKFFAAFALIFVGVYVALSILGILSFVPSRHILFLSPLFFIIIAFAIDYGRKMIGITEYYFIVVAILLIGSLAFKLRADATFNFASLAFKPLMLDQVLVGDCSYDLLYKTWPGLKPVSRFYSPTLDLKKNKPYLYISQTMPFEHSDPNLKIINELQIINSSLFIAYDPVGFPYNRANNIFETYFQLK